MARQAKENWYIPTQSMLVDLVYKVLLCISKSNSLSLVLHSLVFDCVIRNDVEKEIYAKMVTWTKEADKMVEYYH
jgi:hypothetical protein